MLYQIETIFDNMSPMVKKQKKASYETNMKEFRAKHNHYFFEMTDYLNGKEDKEAAAAEVAEAFVPAIQSRFAKNGKIKGYIQADMNFFMIYYVFPAILMTQHEDAKAVADAICKLWGATFKDSKIGYTDYDTLYKSFQEKIFGIF